MYLLHTCTLRRIPSHSSPTDFMPSKRSLSFCCLVKYLPVTWPLSLWPHWPCVECSLEHERLTNDKPSPMAITTWPIFYAACESHIVLQCPLLSIEITLCGREVEDLRRTRNSQKPQSVTTHFNPKLRDHETVTESALCVLTQRIQDISPNLLPPSFDILHWMDMHLMDMD